MTNNQEHTPRDLLTRAATKIEEMANYELGNGDFARDDEDVMQLLTDIRQYLGKHE